MSIHQKRKSKTHGLRYHSLYGTWIMMKHRCNNPNNIAYEYYGGRGISVCERWLHSFENFLEDMGEKPSAEHTLDRIDNNKGYSPNNCKWSTKSEQIINSRGSNVNEIIIKRIRILHKDKAITQRKLAKMFGINQSTVSRIINNKNSYYNR